MCSAGLSALVLAASTSGGADAAAPAKPWNTSVALGVNLTTGNSKTLLTQASILSEFKGAENELRLGAVGNYGETEVTAADGEKQSDVNVQNARAFSEYRRRFGEKNYGYLNAEISHDRIADIDFRLVVGPGLGHSFIKTADVDLGADAGVAYIHDRNGDGSNKDNVALRLAQRYEQKLTATSKLWESIEYLPAFRDFGDYLLNSEIGAEAALNATLNLRVVAQDKFNNRPPDGREKNDLLLIAGVSMKL